MKMANDLMRNGVPFALLKPADLGATSHPPAKRGRPQRNGHPERKASTLESTILARVLIGYRTLVAELGGDPTKMLENAGFAPDVLQAPESKISFRDFALLLENTATYLDCPDFGMRLAEYQSGLALMSPLRTLFENVPTLGQALDYTTRYLHLYCSAIQLYLERRSEYGQPLMRLEVIANDIPYRRQVTEHMLALAYSGAVSRTGGAARPKEIWFSHQKLASPNRYGKTFRATVRFSQPFNAIFFSDEDIQSPIIESSPEILRHELDDIAQKFPYRSQFHRDVKGIISRTVHEPVCNRATTAIALSLHPRTLHRRLRAEGLTFEALRDEVRRDLAAHYLTQSDVTLVDVAGRLGYSELSVLSRSCRRWFGACPTQVRRDLLAQDPSLAERPAR